MSARPSLLWRILIGFLDEDGITSHTLLAAYGLSGSLQRQPYLYP